MKMSHTVVVRGMEVGSSLNVADAAGADKAAAEAAASGASKDDGCTAMAQTQMPRAATIERPEMSDKMAILCSVRSWLLKKSMAAAI